MSVEWGEDKFLYGDLTDMTQQLGRAFTRPKIQTMAQLKKRFNLTNGDFAPPMMPPPINPKADKSKWKWKDCHVEVALWRKSGRDKQKMQEYLEGKILQKRTISEMEASSSSAVEAPPPKRRKKQYKVHYQVVYEPGDFDEIEDQLRGGDWEGWEIAPVRRWFKKMCAYAKKKAKEESGVIDPPSPSHEEAVKVGLEKLKELFHSHRKKSWEEKAEEKEKEKKEKEEKQEKKGNDDDDGEKEKEKEKEKETPKRKLPEPEVVHKIDEKGKEIWTVTIDEYLVFIPTFMAENKGPDNDSSCLKAKERKTILNMWIK